MSDQVGPFKCPECDFATTHPGPLGAHRRIHGVQGTTYTPRKRKKRRPTTPRQARIRARADALPPVEPPLSPTVKLPLRARHSINGISYGPGITDVPRALMNHLIHADELAVAADEAFYSPHMKSKIMVATPIGLVGREVSAPNLADILARGIDTIAFG